MIVLSLLVILVRTDLERPLKPNVSINQTCNGMDIIQMYCLFYIPPMFRHLTCQFPPRRYFASNPHFITSEMNKLMVYV